jgi:signal transduction histidine kinase
MRFRTIFLLSISGIVFGLLAASYLVVSYWTRQQVEARTSANLRNQYSTLRELHALRLDEAAKSSQIIAETPRLKAVAVLGDGNTVAQLAGELQRSTRADFFMLTDSVGRPLIQLLGGKRADLPSEPGARMPEASNVGVMVLGERALRVASTPVTVGPDTIGTLTIGFAITADEIVSLRSMTGSEILLLPRAQAGESSLPAPIEEEIRRWASTAPEAVGPVSGDSATIVTIPTSGDLFRGTFLRMHGPLGEPGAASFLVLISVTSEVRSALDPVQNTFLYLSAVVLVITLAIGYLIARGITRPIAALVRGTAEISKGNYDVRIDVPSGVEFKFLARQFVQMSASLKEKIQQLAVRNADLEEALRKLHETQEELVKSERLAATGRMTAQLSHEINNPVHNILSCLQTALKRTPPDAPERELLDVAYEEVERLARLTQQLLQVYRTSMAVPERLSEVNLNDVIRDVVAAYAAGLRDKGITLATTLSAPLPPIQASADKLTQVFVNLLLNARDAMPSGGSITVTTAAEDGSVRATVSDTGVGIPQENIHRIFDAFFTTKNSVSGVGLGLSVTYGVIQQFKGTITVKSAPGAGTTFTITFPRSTTNA